MTEGPQSACGVIDSADRVLSSGAHARDLHCLRATMLADQREADARNVSP